MPFQMLIEESFCKHFVLAEVNKEIIPYCTLKHKIQDINECPSCSSRTPSSHPRRKDYWTITLQVPRMRKILMRSESEISRCLDCYWFRLIDLWKKTGFCLLYMNEMDWGNAIIGKKCKFFRPFKTPLPQDKYLIFRENGSRVR